MKATRIIIRIHAKNPGKTGDGQLSQEGTNDKDFTSSQSGTQWQYTRMQKQLAQSGGRAAAPTSTLSTFAGNSVSNVMYCIIPIRKDKLEDAESNEKLTKFFAGRFDRQLRCFELLDAL